MPGAIPMTETELKPCPFCGGEGWLQSVPGGAIWPRWRHRKTCPVHYDASYYLTFEKALAAGNTRTPSPPDQETVERLREALITAWLIADEAPELNMSNFNDDDVSELNNSMIEVWQHLKKFVPEFRPALNPPPGNGGGWQTIKTVDKDVQPLWLYDPEINGDDSVFEGHWTDTTGPGIGEWQAAVWCNSCGEWHTKVINPTHWMLPPAPPGQHAPGNGGEVEKLREALRPFMPIRVNNTPDYAELTFGEHPTQAMTMQPDDWQRLNDAYAALSPAEQEVPRG